MDQTGCVEGIPDFITSVSKVVFDNYSQIEIVVCNFMPSTFVENLFDSFHINLPNNIVGSTVGRRAEFFAGRYLAKILLQRLGENCTVVDIGPSGEPLWPKGVAGSISHTCDQALCAATKISHYRYIGVDIEKIMKNSLIKEIKSIILDSKELLIQKEVDISMELFFTLAFSAKESLFKSIFTEVNKKFDFNCVKLTNIIPDKNIIELTLASDLSCCMTKGRPFKGHYRTLGDSVMTFIAE